MSRRMNLFVYGSFCQGMVHFSRIENYVVGVKPASTLGSIYSMEVGYPCFVAEGEDKIEGQLMEIEAPEIFFQLLDEFHGFSPINPEKSTFWRLSTPIMLKDGEEVEAEIYALNPAKLTKRATRISGGCWQKRMEESPPLTQRLTPAQAEYIKKLGASTSRDMVPLDSDLYRQLTGMNLITDKGRRMALTRLGKEVYRYL